MPEIQEVMDDFGKNTKKLLKSKPFKIALVGVAGVALFVAWKKYQEDEENQVVGYVAADGYAGYPVTGGGSGETDLGYADSGDNSGMTNEELAGIIADTIGQAGQGDMVWGDALSDVYDYMDSVNSNVETLAESMYQMQDMNSMLLEEMMKQSAIDQMKANSNLYNNVSDYGLKQQLHDENMMIADQFGFTFNPDTGNYYENGSMVYTTIQQDLGKQTSTGTAKTETTTNLPWASKMMLGLSSFVSGFFVDGPSNAPNAINEGKSYSNGTSKKVSVTPNYTNNRTYQENLSKEVSKNFIGPVQSNTIKTNTGKAISIPKKTISGGKYYSGGSKTVNTVKKSTTNKTTTKKTTTTTPGKTYSGGSKNVNTVKKTTYTGGGYKGNLSSENKRLMEENHL